MMKVDGARRYAVRAHKLTQHVKGDMAADRRLPSDEQYKWNEIRPRWYKVSEEERRSISPVLGIYRLGDKANYPLRKSVSIMTDQELRARVRKGVVVAAVSDGLLSLEESCERYKLSVDKFLSWQRSIERDGLPGLRATSIQDYRRLIIKTKTPQP